MAQPCCRHAEVNITVMYMLTVRKTGMYAVVNFTLEALQLKVSQVLWPRAHVISQVWLAKACKTLCVPLSLVKQICTRMAACHAHGKKSCGCKQGVRQCRKSIAATTCVLALICIAIQHNYSTINCTVTAQLLHNCTSASRILQRKEVRLRICKTQHNSTSISRSPHIPEA